MYCEIKIKPGKQGLEMSCNKLDAVMCRDCGLRNKSMHIPPKKENKNGSIGKN